MPRACSPGCAAGFTLLLAMLLPPSAQGAAPTALLQSPPDSARLHAQARELQAAFEGFRESNMPAPAAVWDGNCDLRVGRMCMRHDRGESLGLPPEPPQVELARIRLLEELGEIGFAIPGDGWVLGHRVQYNLEGGSGREAEELALRCDGAEPWWCAALLGLVFHRQGETLESEAAFARALDRMPPRERRRWTDAAFLLDGDGRRLFDRASDPERERLHDRLWTMADPLYMVPGNDRLTEQFSRNVVRLIREDAANPYGIPWEFDLEELLIRYGAELAWERRREAGMPQGLQDARRVVGRQAPGALDYVPAGSFVEDPGGIREGAWTLERWTPRTGYRAPYAPEMVELESQVARFRRGDSLLVVVGHQPAPERPFPVASTPRPPSRPGLQRMGGNPQPPRDRSDPFGSLEDPFGAVADQDPEAALEAELELRGSESAPATLFLVPEDGEPISMGEWTGTRGVRTAQVPNGSYLVSVEALENRRGWRTRVGVRQRTIPPDLAAVSDLVLLRAGEELPGTLDEALPRVLPSSRITPGVRITVGWEVYGLQPEEPMSVVVGLSRGEPGLLQRVGELLRVVQPEAPVTLTFQETVPGGIFGRTFRSVDLTLPPEMEAGDYVLFLEVALQGRNPLLAERALTVRGVED